MPGARICSHEEVDIDRHWAELPESPNQEPQENHESGCAAVYSNQCSGLWTLIDYASVVDAERNDRCLRSHFSKGDKVAFQVMLTQILERLPMSNSQATTSDSKMLAGHTPYTTCPSSVTPDGGIA